ncbi:MAG: helix-turn-helix transcriptional regulator [Chloroflexi bacterium]|nr:helix-turn-helix transcriptional regulator [Chloroflexota bacterium]
MAKEPKEPLTPREEDVLALLRRGLTNAQLASELGISDNTAKDHVSSILHKLSAKTRDEAAYWPDNAPWWARAPLIAPLALFLRRSATRLPISPSMAATVLAGAALIAIIAGLSLLALLLLRTNGSGTRAFVMDDISDLEPGMTMHIIEQFYRRHDPEADISAEHLPETFTTESWTKFDENGVVNDRWSETRLVDGTLLSKLRMEGTYLVREDADGVEQERVDWAGSFEYTVDDVKTSLAQNLDEALAELEKHPDAARVTIRGVQLRIIEERRPLDIGGIPTPTADSLSSVYIYDLQPVEWIKRDYYSADGVLVRSDIWVANEDGAETLINRDDSLVFEFLKN